MGSFFSIYTLLGLPILIAQWIGVIALRRSSGGAAWVMMIVGVSINSLMAIWPFIVPLVLSRLTSSSNMWWAYAPAVIGITGSLLFAIGFAIHGLQSARAVERQKELEQLATAMSEEIDRLKAGSPT